MIRPGRRLAWAVLVAVTAAPWGAAQEAGKKPGRVDFHGDPLPEGAVARFKALRWRYGGSEWDVEAAVAFTPGGKTLLSAGPDAFFRAWRVADGKPLWQIAGPRPPHPRHGLAASPDGKTATLFGNQGLHLWDYSRKQLLTKIAEYVESAAFSPDGKLLAVVRKGAVEVYAVPSGERRQTFHGPDGAVLAAGFADGGRTCVTLHGKGKFTFWDVNTGAAMARRTLAWKHRAGDRYALSPDASRLAVFPRLNKNQPGVTPVLIADVRTGKILHQLVDVPAGAQVPQFSPDGKTLAVSGDRDIALFDVGSGRRVHVFPCGPWTGRKLAFSSDGATLAAAGPGVRLWDVATGRERATFGGHDAPVTSIAFSADGKRIATGCPWPVEQVERDPTVRVWEVTTGKPLQVVNGNARTVGRVLLTPDGRHVLAGFADGTAGAWEVDTGKETRRWPAWGDPKGLIWQAQTMALSSDGKRLTTVRWLHHGLHVPGTVIRSDLATGKELTRQRIQPGVGLGRLALSDDSRILATMLDRAVTVNDLTAAERTFVLPIDQVRHNELFSVGPILSAEGGFLAALSRVVGSNPPEPQKLHLWEVATGRTVRIHDAGSAYVSLIALSPDGRLLATAGIDAMRVWDLSSGQERIRRVGHGDRVRSLAFAPDGSTLASGLMDGSVLLWDVTPTGGANPAPVPIDAHELLRLWEALAGADALRAYEAMWRLVAVPDQSLPLLRERLRPALAADPERLKRLLADLNSERFAVRNRANAELGQLGEQAAPALREALAKGGALEEVRRVEKLLVGLRFVSNPELVRRLRAIQALERMGTPEARQILQRLAGGAAGARETEDARSALERLARR
jgi:WD40 repeat protein